MTALAGITVGSVSVDVVPSAETFAPRLQAILDTALKPVTQRITSQISSAITQGFTDAGRTAGAHGAAAGGAFADGFRARVDAALRSLPAAKIAGDTSEVQLKIDGLRTRLEALRDLRIGIDIQSGEALAELTAVQTELARLSHETPDVQVRVDVGKAAAELAAFQAEVDRVDGKKIDIDTRQAESGLSGLLTTVVGLGPALIPIGAAATAGLAGITTAALAGAGGLGVLVLGLSGVTKAVQALGANAANPTAANLAKVDTAMAALGPSGQALARTIVGQVLPAFDRMKATAQAGLLPGFDRALSAILPLMPQVQGLIASLATTMGNLATEAGQALNTPFWQRFFAYVAGTAGPTLDVMTHTVGSLAQGFAGLLEAFAPVTDKIGAGIARLAGDFASFGAGAGSNAGFQSFLAYIEQTGPQVIHTFGAIAAAVGHLLAAFAPLGPIVLSVVTGLSAFVSLIPTPALTALAAALVSVVLGVKALNLAQSAGKSVMKAWNTEVAGAALGPYALAVVTVVTAVGLFAGMHAQAAAQVRAAKQAVDDFVTSLHIDYASLESIGNALTQVRGKIDAYAAAIKRSNDPAALYKNAAALQESIRQYDLLDAKKKQAEVNEHALAVVYGLSTTQVEKLAQAHGVDLSGALSKVQPQFGALLASVTATHQPTSALANDMKILGDRTATADEQVNALTDALARMAGDSLSADEAGITFRQDIISLTAALKASHGSLSENSVAGLAARQAFDQAAQQAIAYASATEKSTGSTSRARAVLETTISSLQKTAGTSGYARDAIDHLRGVLDKLPGSARGASSGVQAAMDAIAARAKADGGLIGKYLTDGITFGVKQGTGTVLLVTKQLIDGILTTISRHAIITSPSKVTTYYGEMLAQGLIDGLTKRAGGVAAAAAAVAKAALSVMQAITQSVTPQASDPTSLAGVYGPDLGAAINAQAIAGLTSSRTDALTVTYDRLARQLAALKAADAAAEAAARAHAQALANQAHEAMRLAEVMPTASKAERDAKKAAEEHARALADEARSASQAVAALVAADNAREASLQKLVEKAKAAEEAAKSASSAAIQAAQTAAAAAQQAAQDLIASVQSEVNDLISTVQAFTDTIKQGLTGDYSITTLWGQLSQAGDATVANLQTNLDAILTSTQQFATDLSALATAGANQQLLAQVAALGPQVGDALAQQLLTAGAPAIDALQTTMGKIASYATGEAESIAKTFYGPGVDAMTQFIQGLISQFPELQAALAPIIAEIGGLFAQAGLTPVVNVGAGVTASIANTELLYSTASGATPALAYNGANSAASVTAPFTGQPSSGGPSSNVAAFTGALYLDSGEFLGMVRGEANSVADQRDAALLHEIGAT